MTKFFVVLTESVVLSGDSTLDFSRNQHVRINATRGIEAEDSLKNETSDDTFKVSLGSLLYQ